VAENRRAAALAVIGALLALGCDETPAAPAPPPEPPSISVPQLGPGFPIDQVGWLADGQTVYVIASQHALLWDPRAGRILADDVVADPWLSAEVHVSAAGLTYASKRMSADGTWSDWPAATGSGVVRSPSLDRSAAFDTAEQRVLLLEVDGHEPVRVPIGDVTIAFTEDGQRIVTCDEHGVEIRASDTGAWLAGSPQPADYRCEVSPGDRFVVAIDDGRRGRALRDDPHALGIAHLLDGTTLAPVGDPIEHVRHVAVARDGRTFAIATTGSLEGFSVFDTETREVLAHVSMPAPDALAVRGEHIVIAGREGGVYSVARQAWVIRGSFDARQVTEDGRTVHVVGEGNDARVVVTTPDGTEQARLDLPARAQINSIVGGWMVVQLGERLWAVDPDFTAHALGDCTPDAPSASLDLPTLDFGPRATFVRTAEGRVRRILRGCIERDDGTIVRGDFEELTTSADGAWFVSVGATSFTVRSTLDGSVRSTLALDEAETMPCGSSQCALPIEFSADGSLVAMARNDELRIFDAASGARLARAHVSPRTSEMTFSGDAAVLFHVGSDETRTLFALPRLRPIAHWTTSPAERLRYRGMSSELEAGLVLDESETEMVVRDLHGAVVGRRDLEGGAGAFLLQERFLVRVDWTPGSPGRLELFTLPALEPAAWLEGHSIGAGEGFLATRVGDAVSLTRWSDEGAPVTTPLAAHVTTLGAWRDGVLIGNGEDFGEVRLVRMSDGRAARVLAVARGDELSFGFRDEDGPLAGTDFFMLRRTTLTSDGMVPEPVLPATPDAWLTAGSH
jgi:hypothetical protein